MPNNGIEFKGGPVTRKDGTEGYTEPLTITTMEPPKKSPLSVMLYETKEFIRRVVKKG
jgi:hypothetical protein